MAASFCFWPGSNPAVCWNCGIACATTVRCNSSEPGMLLEARAITRVFGSFRAVADADLEVNEGEIVGLIGPNGAGKSTFFNCLSGEIVPTSGSVRFAGKDVTRASPEAHGRLGMGRTFQIPATFTEM